MFDNIFSKLNPDGTTYCDLVLRDEISIGVSFGTGIACAVVISVVSYPDLSFFSLSICGVNNGKNYNDVRITDRTVNL